MITTKSSYHPGIRGKIYEKGFTYKSIALQLGISPASFGKKMSSKTEFTASEIRQIKKILNLSNNETIQFFLL